MNWQSQSTHLLPLGRSLLILGVSAAGTVGMIGTSVSAQTPAAVDTPILEPAPAAFPTAPAASDPPPAAVSAPLNDTYIDSTDYGIGATHRTPDLAVPSAAYSRESLPAAPSGVVGSVNPGSYGVAAIGTTPTLKDFYRRTLRPPAQLGNGNIRLIFPLAIPAPITSLFGWRVHPIFGTPRFHSGTDLGAPIGTPVVAAYAGQVALADFLGGYGLAVALNHNQGKQQTLYGHLSEVFVKAGDLVNQGTVIGRVGSTGNSTGAHLHFEYRELTPDGWVAMDAGSQLEYALAQLVKTIEVSEKGIAGTTGLQVSQKSLAGVSGEIAWKRE